MRIKKLAEVVCPDSSPKKTFVVDDVVAFLSATRREDVPLYAVGQGGYFIYGIIVPEHHLVEGWRDEVMGWSFGVPGGHGYGYTLMTDEPTFEISPALDGTGSDILDRGEATVFLREHSTRGAYVEPSQRLTHVLALHHNPSKQTWERVGRLGDDEAILQVLDSERGWLCTIERSALDDYLVASSSCLVRVVDFIQPNVEEWDTEPGADFDDEDHEIRLRTKTLKDGKLGIARGFDVIRVEGDARTAAMLRLQGKEPRQFATFKIDDWKSKRIVEWSSDPAQLGNYFVESDLPFETSPAFFRPEVLSQYRIDPTRYRVLPDRVERIGIWQLSYDVNDEGQVHAYIIDLARVPYEEQLRWKAFNEDPKGAIARRAYERDFNARWSSEYDPLLSLKAALDAFPKATDVSGPVVWSRGATSGTRGVDVLGYVHADNRKEFEDQIAVMAQVLVEGLHASEINNLAEKRQCRDKKLASIRQLGRLMEVIGIDERERTTIIEPLAEVYKVRSSGVAHKGNSIPKDFREYQRALLGRCDQAMRALAKLVTEGAFKATESR